MLSQEDNVKVVQLAEIFPEIKKEIEEIEQSLLQLSDEADSAELPSSSVETNLFAKLTSMPASDSAAISSDDQNNNTPEKKEAKIISMQPKKRSVFTTLMLAVSVLAVIICIAVIAHLSSANTHYHEQANNLQNRVNQLQQNTLAYQQSLQLYQNPAYQKINLTAVPGKPDALVQLFWNKTTRSVYIADISLPQAPAGKQYQLWALIDGKPISAGLLTENKLPQQMIDFSKADAFAITLEKAGGSETPTLTEMYVMGKTS